MTAATGIPGEHLSVWPGKSRTNSPVDDGNRTWVAFMRDQSLNQGTNRTSNKVVLNCTLPETRVITYFISSNRHIYSNTLCISWKWNDLFCDAVQELNAGEWRNVIGDLQRPTGCWTFEGWFLVFEENRCFRTFILM